MINKNYNNKLENKNQKLNNIKILIILIYNYNNYNNKMKF